MTELPDAIQVLMARHVGVALWATTLGAFLGSWLTGHRGRKLAAETEQARQEAAKIAALASRDTVEDVVEQMERYRLDLIQCRRDCEQIERRAASADHRAAAAELRVIDLEVRCRKLEELALQVGLDLEGLGGTAS